MNLIKLTVVAAASLLSIACSTAPSLSSDSAQNQPASSTATAKKTPAPDSKFAKLEVGMDMSEVQNILGSAPDRTHTYETGKRWIPFYFGNDARRLQALYKGEGCLIFTGGNVWGGAGGDLLEIEADASGACYQP